MKPVVAADPRNMFSQVPFMAYLEMKRDFAEAGRARIAIEPRAELGNVVGGMHGGVLLTLLDVVMASAAVSKVDFQRTAVTLNLHTDFIAPGRGRLVADGEVAHCDDRIAWCRASVTDAEGRVIAQANGSFKYLPLPRETP